MPRSEAPRWTVDQLKEYFEKILDEQRLATQRAERERELAASALREGLFQSIREGDERLREHVHNQFVQIQTALEAAEALEQQRIDNAQGRVDALRAELMQMHEASERAIAKAEYAAERRFESINEFRGQLADQAATFVRREVADASLTSLGRRLTIVEGLAREGAGAEAAVSRSQRASDQQRTLVVGLVGLLLVAASVIVAVIVAFG